MTRSFVRWAGILLAALASTALQAQSPARPEPLETLAEIFVAQEADRCRHAEVHAFDFWIGRWTVTSPEGDTVGVNRIRPTASGCGLLEEWEGSTGGLGTSLTAYDPGRDEWFQHWVGSEVVLKLTGGFVEGSLVLTGEPRRAEREGESVELVDRITWTPLEDGRVRQTWEVSADEGTSWEAGFVGIYHRKGQAAGNGSRDREDAGDRVESGEAVVLAGKVVSRGPASRPARFHRYEGDSDCGAIVICTRPGER